MSLESSGTSVAAILLSPRPLERGAGLFPLLPLLPYRPPLKPLPSEIWSKILTYVFDNYNCATPRPPADHDALKRGLLVVCRELTTVALPLFYAYARISSIARLEKFTEHLHSSDQKWDSIRRIPYSTPGRWVQALDLRGLEISSHSETYRIDTVLTRLFPLLPFLAHFMMSPTIVLSRRVAAALSCRPEIVNLRILKGLRLDTSSRVGENQFVDVLRACIRLEELSIVGTGIEMTDFELPELPGSLPTFKPLELPYLKKLVILSMPCSPLMYALLHSPLPSLRHLTLTPYNEDFVPTSLVARFIQTHGSMLASLHLYTTKTWPAMFLPSPTTLLQSCPNLFHLSLENPLPILTMPTAETSHPLRILSIPRPYPEFLAVLEALLPKLPLLNTVRTRDVRWLRPGMSSSAQQAGVQGEMMEWRRRLSRKGVQVVDSEWKSGLDGY